MAFIPMGTAVADEDSLRIETAKWIAGNSELRVNGRGTNRRTVALSNADTAAVLGNERVRDRKWRFVCRWIRNQLLFLS